MQMPSPLVVLALLLVLPVGCTLVGQTSPPPAAAPLPEPVLTALGGRLAIRQEAS